MRYEVSADLPPIDRRLVEAALREYLRSASTPPSRWGAAARGGSSRAALDRARDNPRGAWLAGARSFMRTKAQHP